MQERIEAMKAIWTKSKPEYAGQLREVPADDDLAQARAEAASAGDRGRRLSRSARGRALAYGDGWLPHAPASRLRRGARARCRSSARWPRRPAGRESVPITVFGVAEDADLVKRYRDAGVARIIFNLPAAKADEVLPVLDRCAVLMR
jgi:hypothetical protein